MNIQKTIEDYQESSMQQTWLDFCKRSNTDQGNWLGDHGIAIAWTKYANKNYHEPMPTVRAKSWEQD